MFRFSHRAFNLVNTVVKQHRSISTVYLNNQNRTALIRLPRIYTALFSTERQKPDKSENTKSPLGSLISDKEKSERTTEDEEAKQARESSWRTMKYTLVVFGITFVCIGGYLVVELGKPEEDEYGNPIEDEYSKLPLLKQYILRTLNELDYYKRLIKEPSRDKLLPDPVKYPYYQPPYTLVLELTDVLVHPDWTYRTGWRFKKRPGVDQFLETLSGQYEIVIYTAEQGMTVFPLLDVLDPKNLISYKLVRDTTHFVDGHHVKNLNKLNRDLKRVVVIDWNTDSVKLNPENLFKVERWSGNDDDAALFDLAAFLKTIADSEVEDVREVMKYYSDFTDPLAVFKEKQKQLQEQQEAEKEEREAKIKKNRWTPSFFKKPPF